MSSPDSAPDQLSTGKLNGAIAVIAFVVVFGCIIFFVLLDFILRFLKRNDRVSTGLPGSQQVITNLQNKGLDKAIIDSLPLFYGSGSNGVTVECAVCLSEVENKEQGRLLPKCKHAFHADCIGMWFQSHATCPICRSTVTASSGVNDEQGDSSSTDLAVLVTIHGTESSIQQRDEDQSQGVAAGSSPCHLTIDIPSTSKVTTEQEFKSPVLEGLKSLRRLVSGGRREFTFAAPAGSAEQCQQ